MSRIDAAVQLGEELEITEEMERMLRSYVGYGPETWVPAAQYEKVMASGQLGDQAKEVGGVFGGQRDDG